MSVLGTDWQLVICEVWRPSKAIMFSYSDLSSSHCHCFIFLCVCINQKSKIFQGQTALLPSTPLLHVSSYPVLAVLELSPSALFVLGSFPWKLVKFDLLASLLLQMLIGLWS